TGGVPYLLLTYSALLPWLLFANALTTSTKSFVENQALLTKVYVPRLLMPFFLLFAIVAAVAVTLWLSALNVKYRDVQYTVPFLSQAWFFATPIAYSALVFPAHLRMWIGVNPMAGVVQGFRWAIIG